MASLEQTPASGKRKKRLSPRIDMTPMVDLAFLLLTFFVMTTTLMKNRGLEILQPAADESGRHREIKAEQVLNIVLGLNDQVYWYMGTPGSKAEQSNFSSSGVRKLLLQKNQQIKDLYVFIKASDKSRYQNMIDMFDEIKITGVANYAMVDLAPEDAELIY